MDEDEFSIIEDELVAMLDEFVVIIDEEELLEELGVEDEEEVLGIEEVVASEDVEL
jgi:predicted Zn-dependent protease with MMP-like domain